ncbi:MAG: excinuclease ABC subunit UvrA [bacterium]
MSRSTLTDRELEPAVELDHLVVRGAREHNLKNVDLAIPKKKLVVFTGVSGSGKSSMAFDTIFAEGQRRYVESLSAYARQFLGQMEKPRYDSIRGLSPTISIEQKTTSKNPRSTVGTITEIHDYLRVLYARAGTQHCHVCGRTVSPQSSQEIVDRLVALPDGTKYLLMAPIVTNRKGEHRDLIAEIRGQGFTRLRLNGEVVGLDEATIDPKKRNSVEVVVDRLVARPDQRARVSDSVETALSRGEGRLVVQVLADGGAEADQLFSEHLYCHHCEVSFPELSPTSFSFNSPLGMCRTCNGLGNAHEVDPERVVPDDALSIQDGAISIWSKSVMSPTARWVGRILEAVADEFGFSLKTPWKQLTAAQQAVILDGLGEREIAVKFTRSGKAHSYPAKWEGVVPMVARLWKETESDDQRLRYAGFMRDAPCPDCDGSRLRPESRAVLLAGRSIVDLNASTIGDAFAWLAALPLEGARAQIAEELLKEIVGRLRFLKDVGLDYLTLNRAGPTLSGGENQRIRLASQMGSELTGVLYILDEPSIGLHPRDNRRLIRTLERLRDIGNTVVVVEHDAEMMETADWIVDFGPGAGIHGGEVVVSGTPAEVRDHPTSLTGGHLSGRLTIEIPAARRIPDAQRQLRVRDARANNLQGVEVAIPVGLFTCVTGVSGAGKSSLINGILYPAAARALNGARMTAAPHGAIDGLEHFDKVINIDQSPIGRTPRSNPATYTKVWDDIRKVFAETREARTYGFDPGRFSFNVKGGRCEACEGAGVVKVEMHFLADVYVQCEVCAGKRFNDATLRVRYRDRTIADLLETTIDEAAEVFANHRRIKGILQTLQDVGLGYLHLGQASTTLSGGEAQRIKLSRELARRATGRTLYILDEPSTGLHFEDVRKLLGVTQQLADGGNTIVMIEHNLDIIKTADWIIDMGPEGGSGGGQVVAEELPEAVAAVEASYTGHFLKDLLARSTVAAPAARSRAGARPPRRPDRPVHRGVGACGADFFEICTDPCDNRPS